MYRPTCVNAAIVLYVYEIQERGQMTSRAFVAKVFSTWKSVPEDDSNMKTGSIVAQALTQPMLFSFETPIEPIS